MRGITYIVIGSIIVLLVVTGIILSFGMASKEKPRILVIPSSVTCFKNETGLAIVLRSNSTVQVDITKALAVLSYGATDNVTVYKLYRNGKEKISLPYHTILKPSEELPIGLLTPNSGVKAFNLTINGVDIQVETHCKT